MKHSSRPIVRPYSNYMLLLLLLLFIAKQKKSTTEIESTFGGKRGSSTHVVPCN